MAYAYPYELNMSDHNEISDTLFSFKLKDI